MENLNNLDQDYDDCSPLDWAMYELATIFYDYQVHPEAIRRIELIVRTLNADKV